MRKTIGTWSGACMHGAGVMALLAALACGGGAGSEPVTVPPNDTGRTTTLDGKLVVPAGMKVTYFARGLDGVRFMAVSPDGVLYATQPGRGRVVRLPDADRDGVADSVVVVVTGLNQPHGLAFRGPTWLNH